MAKFLNWSSVTLAATIAGILVPVWIWRADLSSKSINLRLVSQVSLKPESASPISGLQITLDGVPLASPYLSTLELTNDGDKPIPSADFEGPIEIKAGDGTTIARGEISGSNPKDLEAKLSFESGVVRIPPLLLNPKDSISISLVTSGKQPKFTARARIAGVSGVSLEDGSGKNPSWKLKLTLLVGAVLLVLASSLTNDSFTGDGPIVLRRRSALLVSLVTGAVGGLLFMVFLDFVGYREFWQLAVGVGLLLMTSGGVALVLNRGARRLLDAQVPRAS